MYRLISPRPQSDRSARKCEFVHRPSCVGCSIHSLCYERLNNFWDQRYYNQISTARLIWYLSSYIAEDRRRLSEYRHTKVTWHWQGSRIHFPGPLFHMAQTLERNWEQPISFVFKTSLYSADFLQRRPYVGDTRKMPLMSVCVHWGWELGILPCILEHYIFFSDCAL